MCENFYKKQEKQKFSLTVMPCELIFGGFFFFIEKFLFEILNNLLHRKS